ncbi:uncharacterized protein BJX67DRAFT_366831 [Aspergillus lucknowensis]|uniref:FAD-binding domain-containing protein n=1 Tax=Aspergillus lucknowensis TaxID=176173 RepID=A0ABR4LCF4_9EURO
MPLKILICGAGIAGNALAFWLSRPNPGGHNDSITVTERHPTLRATGLQVDLRGPGIQVLKRMGLEEAFRAKAVQEQGLRLVDGKGRGWGYFPANRSGKGLQSFTTDWEVMRGAFCRLLYDKCSGEQGVEYRFGVRVTEIKQQEGEGVEVVFSDGRRQTFDLVVGADGLGSRMRRMMYGFDEGDRAANPGYHSLGVYAAYGTIQQDMKEGEGYDATVLLATGHRGIMVRRHDPHWYQAYVNCKSNSAEELKSSGTADIAEEKKVLARVFRGVGWESERILHGLVKSEDFYRERIGVVKLDSWSRGRVVLVGDAAYCPSAMTGMGTTCGLVGAYILAGEISTALAESGSQDITAALKRYEQQLRPFMDQVQKGLTDSDNYMDKFPSSRLGIALAYCLFWICSLLRFDLLARWILREDTKGWQLPEYSKMDEAGN